jgi:hypothetical protein
MHLPYGASKDDFEKCKKIIAKLIDDNKNLDEVILKIMNIAYSTGGNYSDKILSSYAKAYLGIK